MTHLTGPRSRPYVYPRFAGTWVAMNEHMRMARSRDPVIKEVGLRGLRHLREQVARHLQELKEHNALMAASGRHGIE